MSNVKQAEKKLKHLIEELKVRLQKTETASLEANKIREEIKRLKG